MNDVWVRYQEKVVLEGICLTAGFREIVSIVGPNGGGKTTLIHALLGLIEPFRGNIEVLGKSPREIQKTGSVGYLPQHSRYDPLFPVNVSDVVAMAVHARRREPASDHKNVHERIEKVLDRVDMLHLRKHHFGSLSAGQQQRVLIARALVAEPKLLVLDEPSTSLDAVAQDAFYQLLRQLRDEEDLTILFVSHDIGSVSKIVDQIACLNRKIHFHGKPQECMTTETMVKVFGKDMNFLLHDEHCRTCEKRT